MTRSGERVWARLTRREQEILVALCESADRLEQLAAALKVGYHTLKNYAHRILEKAGADDRHMLAIFAWANGLAQCPCGLTHAEAGDYGAAHSTRRFPPDALFETTAQLAAAVDGCIPARFIVTQESA